MIAPRVELLAGDASLREPPAGDNARGVVNISRQANPSVLSSGCRTAHNSEHTFDSQVGVEDEQVNNAVRRDKRCREEKGDRVIFETLGTLGNLQTPSANTHLPYVRDLGSKKRPIGSARRRKAAKVNCRS